MKKIPTGNVTFLFTDIEGSTRLAQDFPRELTDVLEKHNNILRNVFESNNGFIFETIGDGFCCAFQNPEDAFNAAALAQSEISKEDWQPAPLKVRMGLNSGNIEWNGSRYTGYLTLAKSNRVMSAAYGGQVLVSDTAYKALSSKRKNLSFRDLGERRLKDISHPVRLYQAILPGLPSEFPPLKTLDARPNNLPSQLSSFVGKRKEIEAVKEKFKESRILTITGPGGAGKTRLALEIGNDVVDDFENGVWISDLASVNDPGRLPETIVCSLRIKAQPDKTSLSTLLNYLKDKNLLLILDTCEHIIEACASLCERILQNSPDVKIIATSRESLKCRGEKTHIVEPLSFPGTKGKLSLQELKEFEAVKLFIDRASNVNPKFKATADNIHLISKICERLEGIPLAIELASARMKVLSLEKISERLEDRFKLLTTGSRTAQPRMQTLKALIDWSFDLLTDEEKILWRRLSVFSGGWSLDAAEEVCSDEFLSKEKILDLLENLTEKSIITFDGLNDWYKMLETIRSYGNEKLIESKEHDAVSQKLLDYLILFTEKTENETSGPDQKLALEQFEKLNANFEAALRWAYQNHKAEEALTLAGGLGIYWRLRGHFQTGRKWLRVLLELNAETSKLVRAKALNWAGTFANRQGNNGVAGKYLDESLSLYRAAGNKQGIASSLYRLGFVLNAQGNRNDAVKTAEECLEIYKAIDDKQGISSSTNLLGILHHENNEPAKAKNYYKESLQISQQNGDIQGIAVCLLNLAHASSDLGNYKEARKHLTESLEKFREIGDVYDAAICLHKLGDLEALEGKYDQAERTYCESINIRKEMKDDAGVALSYYSLGKVRFQTRKYSDALEDFKKSLEINSKAGNTKNILKNLLSVSGTQLALNKKECAATLLGKIKDILANTKVTLDDFEKHLLDQTWLAISKDEDSENLMSSFKKGKELSREQAVAIALNP